MKSNLTPELFSPAQIDFLRDLGVRVEYLGSNQSVFNDRADLAEGRIRALRCSMADALSCDDRYAGTWAAIASSANSPAAKPTPSRS
jgi:hypothetical protein